VQNHLNALERDMDEEFENFTPHVALIENCRQQKRWIDLPIIALDVNDEDTASALIYAAMCSGEENIVLSCLKNMNNISGFPISTQSLLAFLSLRQIETEAPDPVQLVVGIAGSTVTMGMIDRYRAMIEQLLAHRS
jgi:hypothetical protein